MLDKAPQGNDVPAAEAKAEGQSLEWGPDLGKMSYLDALKKIEELNGSLADGEKPWRLPTKDELVDEFNKIKSIPRGFREGYYWSNETTEPEYSDTVVIVNMGSGHIHLNVKHASNTFVRCVRDVA